MNRDAERAMHRRIADEIRAAIDAGAYEPGAKLPAPAEATKEYGCHADTVRAAHRLLAAEGVVQIIPRVGAVVAGADPQMVVNLAGPVRIRARMPTDLERQDWGHPPGVPLLVVEYPVEVDGDEPRFEQHPAHTTTLEVA